MDDRADSHPPNGPNTARQAMIMITLHQMTIDSFKWISAARRGGEQAWRDGSASTKIGIMLDDLLPEADAAKRDWLMSALDAINARFGSWSSVTVL